ncbi:hypothetical protein BH11MYX1_BH11MYX1_49980 [soil metagenome]
MKVSLVFLVAACGSPTAPNDQVPDAPSAPGPDATLADFCNATDPRTVPITIDPTPEASERPYLDVLSTAQTSIDLSVYEMGYGGILDQLEAKARAGVKVRVILDKSAISTNQKYFDALAAAGASVEWSDPQFSYFHAKYFIVDGVATVISTGNFSKTYSIDLERNYVATDRDPADVADLARLFEADFSRAVPQVTCTRMVISPVNARERILAVIAGAQHTLEIESMQFADSGVRAAVQARAAAGVTVRALLAEPSWITANADAATFLKALGVPVKSIPHLHTKMLVADGSVAYVGSENFSYTSLGKNREVGVILVEQGSIDPLLATFSKDWAVGTDL